MSCIYQQRGNRSPWPAVGDNFLRQATLRRWCARSLSGSWLSNKLAGAHHFHQARKGRMPVEGIIVLPLHAPEHPPMCCNTLNGIEVSIEEPALVGVVEVTRRHPAPA